MKTFKILSFILVALIAMGASCNRPPQPTPTPDGGDEVVLEPIIVNGEETGYSVSYRSWIVPGTDAEGNKAPAPPKNVYNKRTSDGKLEAVNTNVTSKSAASTKGTTANDTVSVILHDEFYHVDTVGYVTNWQPEKYQNGSYTCHWDHYAAPRAPEDYITITDSTSILRIQFEEFSFSYRFDFEVATYNNGVINKQMPHYTPVVTDLGLQGEPEVLETICRNDSVFARRVLHHAIRVAVGDKVQTLHAKVTLYRHMPNANPSKFITRSELLGNITETYVPTDSTASTYPNLRYNMTVKAYWSDGQVEDLQKSKYIEVMVHAPLLSSYLYGGSFLPCDVLHTFEYINMTADDYYCYFNYSGAEKPTAIVCYTSPNVNSIYDDGYTVVYRNSPEARVEYSRTRYICDTYATYLRTYVTVFVNNQPQQEVYTHLAFE